MKGLFKGKERTEAELSGLSRKERRQLKDKEKSGSASKKAVVSLGLFSLLSVSVLGASQWDMEDAELSIFSFLSGGETDSPDTSASGDDYAESSGSAPLPDFPSSSFASSTEETEYVWADELEYDRVLVGDPSDPENSEIRTLSAGSEVYVVEEGIEGVQSLENDTGVYYLLVETNRGETGYLSVDAFQSSLTFPTISDDTFAWGDREGAIGVVEITHNTFSSGANGSVRPMHKARYYIHDYTDYRVSRLHPDGIEWFHPSFAGEEIQWQFGEGTTQRMVGLFDEPLSASEDRWDYMGADIAGTFTEEDSINSSVVWASPQTWKENPEALRLGSLYPQEEIPYFDIVENDGSSYYRIPVNDEGDIGYVEYDGIAE